MSMLTNTLGRYFAGRFMVAALGVFVSIFLLLVLVDYIEMVRRTSGLASASALVVAETSLFRVPQLLEKLTPFCVLIGAMTCYLALSRQLELVVARAAGVSAWQFISPALVGLTVFTFDPHSKFKERIEAREAALEDGRWLFKGVRRFTLDNPPVEQETLVLPTSLTPAQVQNSFSTPETVSFWQLPGYIRSSESSGFATAGYRLQYHKLIAQPFLLAAMVMLAASVSLRFFRFGGVQKMVLSGVGSGFLLYVLSKVTEDLSKAELMNPIAAAWLPVCVGSLTGFLVLLHQEDG
ncbi:MAG: permease YjgP/YjgQ [Nitrobacter vulgaris]|nr:permease YjgP/YjgQ [Nitrobacter vulgaris]